MAVLEGVRTAVADTLGLSHGIRMEFANGHNEILVYYVICFYSVGEFRAHVSSVTQMHV